MYAYMCMSVGRGGAVTLSDLDCSTLYYTLKLALCLLPIVLQSFNEVHTTCQP